MSILRLLVLTLVFLFPAVAHAQASDADRATARALAIEAHKAMEAEDHQRAADLFRRAESLYHAPTLMLGLARAYVKLGKYVQARENYNRVLREKIGPDSPEAFKNARTAAEQEIEGLAEKISWVTISVEGPDEPTVTLDGQSVSVASLGVKRAVDPGEHLVEASADGYKASKESFSVEQGSAATIVLKLEAAPDAQPKTDGGTTAGGADVVVEASGTQSTLGIVGLAAGGAGLILGAVTGGMAMGKHGDLEDACGPTGQCDSAQQDNLDSYRLLGTVSTAGFIAGGVLAAVGTVLLVTAPSGADEAGSRTGPAPVAVELGLGHFRASWQF